MLGPRQNRNLFLVLKYTLPKLGDRMYVTRAAEYINTIQRLAENTNNTDEFIGKWIRAHPVVSMHEDHETAVQMVKLAEEPEEEYPC